MGSLTLVARGRRVRRVLRKIDTWSVLKVSALFHVTLVLVLLLAGVLLWAAGSSTGVIPSAEKFMRSVGFEGFTFVGGQLLRGFVAFGLVLVVLGTGLSVLMAVVYNLISDIVGGIQYVVLEEEREVVPAVAAAPTRTPVLPVDDVIFGGAAADAASPERHPAQPHPGAVTVHDRYAPSGSIAPAPVAPPAP